MADAQLRYGLRILYSGGAALLSTEELSKLLKVCISTLDERVYSNIDFKRFCSDVNANSIGGLTRLKKAYRRTFNRELTCSDDLSISCPKKLLSAADFGSKSLLATKKAFELQLKEKELPLPTKWQRAPSWHFDRTWHTD